MPELRIRLLVEQMVELVLDLVVVQKVVPVLEVVQKVELVLEVDLVLVVALEVDLVVVPELDLGLALEVAIARRPLWQAMRNFGHGTGHGVGNVLSVHEGPQSIRQNLKDQSLLPGMITSDEPGIYREGFHGIRHENMILCKRVGENEFGKWLGFETMTRTYLDTEPLVVSMMDRGEIEWLNNFNKVVFEEISDYLNADEKKWLREKTNPIKL